ncbi:MAG: sulfoxide reductase catalytic subunit YedY [Gammaproteobacteria bacterium]|jgi:sulfoxide reductase catalytic subunit YedY
MLIKAADRFKSSEITPQSTYLNRRRFLAQSAAMAGAAAVPGLMAPGAAYGLASDPQSPGNKLQGVVETPYDVSGEKLSSWETITTYNNFYEFGTDKKDPARNSGKFKTSPWKVRVFGECDKPGTYHLEDILKPHTLEERVYRFRCVEAWSMIVPWVGVSLADVLKRFQPNSKAKYVAFRTLFDPQQMPGQRRPILKWPYVEGLRIDEAMNPLSMLVTGLYGEVLPNQNGAPLRLMVPWKYGFKSIKSIASISFTEAEPPTSWNISNAREYGFYSNVNPEVDHPRWSQASERRVGDFFRVKTPMFNGYADEVASMYAGMDLTKQI